MRFVIFYLFIFKVGKNPDPHGHNVASSLWLNIKEEKETQERTQRRWAVSVSDTIKKKKKNGKLRRA